MRYKEIIENAGIDFDMQFDDDTGSFATVTARAQGRVLGSVKFFMDGDTLEADMVEVDERYRGQGIAAAMYDYAKSQGYTIEKSSDLTPDGDHFWRKNRGEEPVWENFADGKNPQDKGDSKRHGVPTKASISTLRKVAKQGGRKGQLAHWMANMKSGRAKAKK
jgi:GNAT superfamily N-acetyltransferase